MSKISQRKRQISNRPLTKLTKSEIIYLIKEEKKKIENIKLDKMYVSEEIFSKSDLDFYDISKKHSILSGRINQLKVDLGRCNRIANIYKAKTESLTNKKKGIISGLFVKEKDIDSSKEEYNNAVLNSKKYQKEFTDISPEYERISNIYYSMSLNMKIKSIDNRISLLNDRLNFFLKKEERIISLKNKAAETTRRKRTIADSIKKQLSKYPYCPYCFGEIGENPHADHIYPVSKGGESLQKNMVFVCNTCNLNKGDKTLSAFIKKYNLNRDKIEHELDILGKEY